MNTVILFSNKQLSKLNPYDQGKLAANLGESADVNPFGIGTSGFYAWRRGYFNNLTEFTYED